VQLEQDRQVLQLGYIGADGPDEDTAIYLCQNQRSLNEMHKRVARRPSRQVRYRDLRFLHGARTRGYDLAGHRVLARLKNQSDMQYVTTV